MQKGFSTWIMSKLVMLIFLFSLVVALSEYYMIYKEKTVDDTAKMLTQSIAEEISDALAYRTTTRTIWLDSMIWIRDTSKPYTLFLEYVSNAGGYKNIGRLAIFMVWNDKQDITNIRSFAAASGVSLIHNTITSDSPYSIDTVCFYNMDKKGKLHSETNGLLIRPSALNNDNRSNYILIYKYGNKLCIANNNVNVDLKDGLSKLKSACSGCS